MTPNELAIKVEEWAVERNLHNADPHRQLNKLLEEAGELAEGLNKNDKRKVMDAIGDCYVVLSILALQHNVTMNACVNMAYEEIKDRKGKTINGMFVKESDLKG